MPVNGKDRANAEAFWRWIADHKVELNRRDEGIASEVLDEAAEVLHRYDPTLGFEVSQANGTIELTVTAFGRQESFESVKWLIEWCLPIPGLRAFAFRQPEGTDFELEVGGHVFSPKGVYFDPMKGRADPKSVGLMIFFPGGDEIPPTERLQVARIMLQAILGEYEATTRVDHLEVGVAADKNMAEYIALSDIVAYLKWFEERNPRTTQ